MSAVGTSSRGYRLRLHPGGVPSTTSLDRISAVGAIGYRVTSSGIITVVAVVGMVAAVVNAVSSSAQKAAPRRAPRRIPGRLSVWSGAEDRKSKTMPGRLSALWLKILP